jgi:16S rRNA processing protein RimM
VQLVVARVGRPHGIHGEVSVEVRTDDPQGRFVAGARLDTDPASAGPLTIATVRDHNGKVLLTFDEVPDRTAAEGLRGVLLLAEADATDEPEAWYDHELVGLAAHDPSGERLGEVVGVEHGAAQDLLVVRLTDGRTGRVPFVAALVPEVDPAAGRVVVDPPPGLFDEL